MKVKIITEKGVATLQLGSPGANAFDLVANIKQPVSIFPQMPAKLIPTGIKLDMTDTPGLCGMIIPRSGLGHKQGLVMGNGVGLIDNDYQGELHVSAWNRNPELQRSGMGSTKSPAIVINPGDRLAQIIFVQTATHKVDFVPVNSFDAETDRGEGGFGSTGVSAKD